MKQNFELDKIVIDKPVIVENVYYDLGKSKIRDAAPELDKLVQLLNENPNIEIEIGSRTDSRAGDQYNLSLSEKRAKAVVDYLVLKGIDRNRLTSKGYGEKKLVNHCINIVKFAEEEHQKTGEQSLRLKKYPNPALVI